jgi:hypothetical protein
MIIDALKHVSNKVMASAKDSTSGKLLDAESYVTAGYTLFPSSDKLVWSITDTNLDNTTQYLQVNFIDSLNIKSITYDITATTSPSTKLLYSYDDVVFEEFKYISYSVVGEVPDTILKYQDLYLQVTTINTALDSSLYGDYFTDIGTPLTTNTNIVSIDSSKRLLSFVQKVYALYDPTIQKVLDTPVGDMLIVKEFIESEKLAGTSDLIKWKYEFVYMDTNTNTEKYIINTLPIRSIRIVCERIGLLTVPFTLTNLVMNAEVVIESVRPSLPLMTETMFMPKYFVDYPFIPSITKSFFEMWSDKGTIE